MELTKYLFGNKEQLNKKSVPEQGAGVMATINYPKYIYLHDVVVPKN